jgi:hypothetical protein
MKTEQIEQIKNAIRIIKATPAATINEGLQKGLNLLFINGGNDFKFGIDSHYPLQIQSGLNRTKADVLFNLERDLESIK